MFCLSVLDARTIVCMIPIHLGVFLFVEVGMVLLFAGQNCRRLASPLAGIRLVRCRGCPVLAPIQARLSGVVVWRECLLTGQLGDYAFMQSRPRDGKSGQQGPQPPCQDWNRLCHVAAWPFGFVLLSVLMRIKTDAMALSDPMRSLRLTGGIGTGLLVRVAAQLREYPIYRDAV